MALKMVPESINFHLFLHKRKKSAICMPKGAILKKECKKVLLNSFAMMQFSYFDQLFFPTKKQT